MVTAELFKALGDPTRLEIVERLSNGEPYTISKVSSGLGITRQGARKHLQILADARVVILEPKGRDTKVILDNDTLKVVKAFIAKLEQQWDNRLLALKQIVEKEK